MNRRSKMKIKGVRHRVRGAIKPFLSYTLNYIYMAVIIALIIKYI